MLASQSRSHRTLVGSLLEIFAGSKNPRLRVRLCMRARPPPRCPGLHWAHPVPQANKIGQLVLQHTLDLKAGVRFPIAASRWHTPHSFRSSSPIPHPASWFGCPCRAFPEMRRRLPPLPRLRPNLRFLPPPQASGSSLGMQCSWNLTSHLGSATLQPARVRPAQSHPWVRRRHGPFPLLALT
jgi:hypothetical protein